MALGIGVKDGGVLSNNWIQFVGDKKIRSSESK